jgi:hypothetical protein
MKDQPLVAGAGFEPAVARLMRPACFRYTTPLRHLNLDLHFRVEIHAEMG